jgi:hypothetical protein
LDELKLEAELVKVTDVFEIIDKGISVTPALVVDGKVPSVTEIRYLLSEEKS